MYSYSFLRNMLYPSDLRGGLMVPRLQRRFEFICKIIKKIIIKQVFLKKILTLQQIFVNRVNMFGLGMQEILIIALIVLLLFGGKKIPELMKGLGKGVKSFKEGMNEVTDITKDGDKSEEAKGEK